MCIINPPLLLTPIHLSPTTMSFRSALAPLRQAVRASASSSRAAPASARAISSTSARRSESLFVHRDTDYNNPNVSHMFPMCRSFGVYILATHT